MNKKEKDSKENKEITTEAFFSMLEECGFKLHEMIDKLASIIEAKKNKSRGQE